MAKEYQTYPHYIPIVKWQKWERLALKKTEPAVAERVLPCIEVRTPDQHKRMLDEYDGTWKNAALVDYSDPYGNLTSTRSNELIEFLKKGKGSAKFASPVLNPSAIDAAFPAIRKALGDRTIALRTRLGGVDKAEDQVAVVAAAMKKPGVSAATNRLIIDLGATPIGVSDAAITSFVSALGKLKALGFEHIHLASGAFPESLMHIVSAGEVERRDWALWERAATTSPGLLLGFSDYGPLTPKWTEETLQRRGGRSVIRYALEDKWRIIRSQSNQTSDSIAISELMVTIYAQEFKGRPFSYGDLLIADRAAPVTPLKNKHCGQYHITEFWNHHIAFVVKEQY